MALLFSSVALSPDGFCDSSDDAPQLEFTYSDGSTVFVKLSDTDIATSTVVTEKGMTHDSSVFNLGLDRMPTSVTIHSNTGKFRLSISMKLSDPGMAGQTMKLHFGDYTENLFPLGGYSCVIPSSDDEWLSPNHRYATSLYIDDGTGTFVPYDPASGLSISIRLETSEDTRFVRFFFDSDVIGSKFYNPGDKIGSFPATPDTVLPISGWYDSLGKKVDSDTVYDYEGDMDFHTAYGFDMTTLGILILLTLIMGICGYLITERMD